jgi:hypothetical protein
LRDADNLAALIDDADAWADQFCASLPGQGLAMAPDPAAPIALRARAYRDLLYCRFADQAFSATRSARHGRPVTTSSLIRAAFETFTHLFELRDHLETAFAHNSLDGLDALLAARLFGGGAASEDGAEPEDFSLGLDDGDDALDEADEPTLRLPIADNDGPDGPAPEDDPRIDPGADARDDRADLALRRLMRTLIAVETSFDSSYRALDPMLARLDEMFA